MAGESVRFVESAIVSSYFPTSSAGDTSQQSRWQGGRLWAAKKWLMPLMGRIARGQFRLIEPVLDLAGLPMAFGVVALAAEAFLPLHWTHVYVAAAFCVIAGHVVAAAWAGPDFSGTLRLLVVAPFYIVWKIRLLPKFIKASSKRAAWIKTDRGSRASSPLRGDTV